MFLCHPQEGVSGGVLVWSLNVKSEWSVDTMRLLLSLGGKDNQNQVVVVMVNQVIAQPTEQYGYGRHIHTHTHVHTWDTHTH